MFEHMPFESIEEHGEGWVDHCNRTYSILSHNSAMRRDLAGEA